MTLQELHKIPVSLHTPMQETEPTVWVHFQMCQGVKFHKEIHIKSSQTITELKDDLLDIF